MQSTIKKVLLSICIGMCFCFSVFSTVEAKCQFSENVKGSLTSCMSGTELVKKGADIEGSFKDSIIDWTKSIAFYLGIASVFAIVYAGGMMTLSAGDDEKISKAKNILKWSIFGLLGVIFAAAIITLTIKIIYGL